MARNELDSRRGFLRNLGLLLGFQILSPAAFAADKAGSKTKAGSAAHKLAPWTGDEFALCHKLRVGDFGALPQKCEKKVDFVIVGGGVAGLTAAYNLKDHDFLLLEQCADLGGHARGSSYHGIDYSYAAACLGSVEGKFAELYAALALEPILLPPEHNEFYLNGKWFAKAPQDPARPVFKELSKLLADAREVWKKIPPDGGVQEMCSGELEKLDAGTFRSGLATCSPELLALLESCCSWDFGGRAEQLSTLAGYMLLRDLVSPTYVLKGGNPAVARALSRKIAAAGSRRCLTHAFVWKIEVNEQSASVVYSLADGSSHRVECKHVIVATPPLVASRQLVHIPDLLKAQLFRFKYSSYLVTNFLLKEKLFRGEFDNFVSPPFSFADLSVAETPYMLTHSLKPEMGSVLTIYQPYPSGSEGRTLLLEGDREKFASSLAGQLEKLVPGVGKSIDEIVLSRWGHAQAVVGPGYYSRLAKMQSMQTGGACSLAHSACFGRPGIDSAITAGQTAAQRALRSAGK
jgi:protoporphyrinogen oxidase